MNKLFAGLVLSLSVLFFSCQKEKSFELDGPAAQGSLQEDGGGLCLPKTVNGVYVANTALVPATNTITVDIDVATAGNYNIYTDTINGYHFRGTGNFTANGMQTVTLSGSGTPLVAGNNVFTVFFDSTECDITVQVLPAGAGGPATFTLNSTGGNCSVTVPPSGNYVIGTALTSANTVSLSVNVTAIGSYDVSTTTVQGITFRGTGTLSATGTQTIILTATSTSTPVAPAGTVNLSVTVGSTTCTFPVTITTTPTTTFTWQFTVGSTTYQGVNDSISYDITTLPPPFIIVDHFGTNAAMNDYNLAFLDIAGGVTANETYNSNVTTLANAGYFYFFGGGIELEAADPSITPGVNIIIRVTSHNTATKTIIGTFSGTAHDYTSNTTKTVSNGSFTIVYP